MDFMISADVETYVLQNFPEADAGKALELLRGAVTHTGAPAGPRLVRCAAIASGKSLSGLQRLVAELKVDYRDVIVSAEYIVEGTNWVRVRDLNHPIP